MASVNCSISNLIASSKCFNCLSQIEDAAAVVYFLELRRAQLAGVAPDSPATLRKAVQCFCTPPDLVADALDAAVAQAGAVAGGVVAAGTMTMAQIRSAINPFRNMSISELRNMEILLRCKLNAFP